MYQKYSYEFLFKVCVNFVDSYLQRGENKEHIFYISIALKIVQSSPEQTRTG